MATPRPCIHDHEAVLDLWADGRTLTEIATRLKIASTCSVASIVQKARMRGEPRAHARNPGPTVRRVGYLPPGLVPIANRAARAHGISVSDLCIRIIAAVFRDGLVNAVLDDDPPAPGRSSKNTPSVDANRDEHSKHLLPAPSVERERNPRCRTNDPRPRTSRPIQEHAS